MLTPAERLTKHARRELDGKRRVLEEYRRHIARATENGDAKSVHKFVIVANRLQKSLANRMAKALCPHVHARVEVSTARQHGITFYRYRCPDCKTTISHL